jgi:hypothetical protein
MQVSLRPSYLRAVKLPRHTFTPMVIGRCPRCDQPVTKEHEFGGRLHKLDGKPLHPGCFHSLRWTLANRCTH